VLTRLEASQKHGWSTSRTHQTTPAERLTHGRRMVDATDDQLETLIIRLYWLIYRCFTIASVGPEEGASRVAMIQGMLSEGSNRGTNIRGVFGPKAATD